jgi:hypothetical protein
MANLYIMSRTLLDFIFDTLLVFTYWCKIQTNSELIFNNIAYTRYDVLWFMEKMDFSLCDVDVRHKKGIPIVLLTKTTVK